MKKRHTNQTTISGYEANAILFAFDKYYDTDAKGIVHQTKNSGLTIEELNQLRQRLFSIHQHPDQ